MAMQRGGAKYHPLADSPGSNPNLRGANVGGIHAIREVHRLLKILEGNLQNSNSISPRENAHISARECLRRRRLCLLSELQKNGLTFIFTGL